jgi:5-oxopent-3-ene-1,2,5-tricarboxylate decarboxylase/2-hydroxyhepta-2,4-diene-1,7-dioate isomerase
MDTSTYSPRVVYGTLLNDRATLARLADTFTQPPYKAPPVNPVLYIKPANTYAAPGAQVAVPADPGVVRIDATLGVVMLRDARGVSAADAMDYVAGYLIASDVTLPHDDVYRPPLRQRCRDGFCPMTPRLSADPAFDPNRAVIEISINGKLAHRRSLEDLHRPIAQLIADISAYMTLSAGAVLLVGAPEGAPLAHPGDHIRIDVPGLGSLEHSLVIEAPEASA